MIFSQHRRQRAALGRLAFAAVTAWLACVPASASVSPSEQIKLPSEMCRGVFIVPVSLDGVEFELLLDTGSSWTFLDSVAVSRKLERRVVPSKISFASARIGPLDLGPLKARTAPLQGLSRALGRGVDGILGFPEFRDVLLTLDYPAREIRISRGELPPADGKRVLRDTGGKRPWIEARIGSRRLELQIDSGATRGHLQIRSRDRTSWAVEPRAARVTALFGGYAIDRGGRLSQDLAFGAVLLQRPVAFVADRDRQFGWEIMRHFSWTFDQKKDRIAVDRSGETSVLPSPPLVSRGFGFRAARAGHEVLHVLPETPAALAGLRAGDVVTAIDGVPVYERGCDASQLDLPGRRSRISFLRDGVVHEAVIETVTLIP